MTEINNNIPNFGRNTEKTNKKQLEDTQKTNELPSEKETANSHKEVIYDSGVLGRSQVKTAKGFDIYPVVNRAFIIAKNKPELLSGSESMFNYMYNNCIAKGLKPSEAYMRSLIAEAEFLAAAGENID